MTEDRTARVTAEPERVRSAAEFGWDGPVRLPDVWNPLLEPHLAVTFGRVVMARHYTKRPELRAEALAVEGGLRAEFARQEGQLVNTYYCAGIIGGAALTEQADPGGRGRNRSLHTVLQNASPALVELESRCHRLMAQANAVFGERESAFLQRELVSASNLIFSAMTRVLRAADTDPATPERAERELAAQLEVESATRRVEAIVHRETGFIYFQGLLVGAVATLAVCTGVGLLAVQYWSAAVDAASLVAAIVFGALGAVASVFQRISADKVVLTFMPSRRRMLALGALRPLVGATFGAVVHFALVGGVLGSVADSAGESAVFALSAVTGFAAGFTERFATDVIRRAAPPAPAAVTVVPEQRSS